MTVREVLKAVATMPRGEWIKIQHGIADLISSQTSPEEVEEIRRILAEAEAELARGEGVPSEVVRRELGLA